MSNPRRRSTRLVNAPRIDYEEHKIELKPNTSSSKKKKREEYELKSDDKKIKKAKLRHEIVETSELVVNFNHSSFQDDEDTIVDFSGSESDSDLFEKSLLDISVDDTTTRYKLNDDIDSSDLDKKLNSDSNGLKQSLNDLNRSVDSEGFLIPDDSNTNQPSSQDNQNIIDVTDYDKFFELDDSIIENCLNNSVKEDTSEIKTDKKRIKKFVKKQKSKSNKILTNFVKVTRKSTAIEDDSQATEILNENLISNQLNSPDKNSSNKPSFLGFFMNENINKSNTDSDLIKNDALIVQVNDQIPKRKRGRPRKSEVLNNSSVSIKNDNHQFVKPTEIVESIIPKKPIVIDSSDDCDVIEVKANKEIDLGDNFAANLLVDLDKEDDVILVKSDEPWTVKYKPLSSEEVLDNEEASNKIKEWIDDFIKPDNKYYDDDFEGNCLESCVLIHGPTGCGKTAMVYALAEELNYKVFEINCSSRRNGKIINQIKEATLSHTVSRKSTSNSQSPVKNPKQQINKQADAKQKTLFSFFQKKKSIEQVFVNKPPLIDESSFSQETVNNLKALSINSNSL